MEEYPRGILEMPRARSCSNAGPPAESWLLYTAFGGCIAHGGLRATAGESHDFNPQLLNHTHPLSPAPFCSCACGDCMMPLTGGPMLNTPQPTHRRSTYSLSLYRRQGAVHSLRMSALRPLSGTTFQWIHLRPVVNHLPGMAFDTAAINPSYTCNGRIPRVLTLPHTINGSDIGPMQNPGHTTYSDVQLTLDNIEQQHSRAAK